MFKNPRYEEIFCFSFKEILDPDDSYAPWQLGDATILAIAEEMELSSSVFNTAGEHYAWANANYGYLMNLVFKRFNSMIAVCSEERALSEYTRQVFIYHLTTMIEMTKERYITLLTSYTSAAAKLLAPLKTTIDSSNRFNDTPQNTGDFSTDPFTTSINQISSTTEVETETIMSRLRELQRDYRNVLTDWSDEFAKIFIEEANV